jgi:prepilin-type N-terminal cleavage/methylation domain-containing protein
MLQLSVAFRQRASGNVRRKGLGMKRMHVRRGGFTLIELLVVIVIIAVLASMLLPALRRAKFFATKTVCLGAKRQLGITAHLFGSDYNGRVPRGVNGYTSGNRDLADYASLARGNDSLFHSASWGGRLGPLGVMCEFGYVEDAKMLYCAGWEPGPDMSTQRNYRAQYFMHLPRGYEYDETRAANRWNDLIDGDDSLPNIGAGGAAGPKFGVSHFLAGGDFVSAADSAETGYDRDSAAKLRFDTIASKHHDSTKYTPLLFVCTQDDPGSGTKVICHAQNGIPMGMNGVFYDGSARWISAEELYSYNSNPWVIYNNRFSTATGYTNMFSIARQHLTLSRE